MQPLIINTLLYIIRNPLNTDIFPKEILKYKSSKKIFKKYSSPDSQK